MTTRDMEFDADYDPDFDPETFATPGGDYVFPMVDPLAAPSTPESQQAMASVDSFSMDIRTDSATSIVNMMVMRANGGCSVEDMAVAPITDLFVKSAYESLATGREPGATFEITFPTADIPLADIELRRLDLISQGGPPVRLHTYRSELIGRRYGLDAGERSARAFSGGPSVPVLNSRLGGALRNLRDVVGMARGKGGVSNAVYSDFSSMWGLGSGAEDLVEAVEIAGNPEVRLAALDDKAYHTVLTSYGRSGAVKVAQVPMTQKSINEATPIPWQKLRQGLRAVGIANEQTDQNIQRCVDNGGTPLKLTMDLVAQSLPSSAPCRHLSEVLRVIRASFPTGMPRSNVPRDVMTSRLHAMRSITELKALYYEQQWTIRQLEEERRATTAQLQDDPIPAAEVKIPSVRVSTTGPPRIIKLSQLKIERAPELAIKSAGKREEMGDVRGIVSQQIMGIEDITSAFRYAIAARALDRSTFLAQVRYMIAIPNPGGKEQFEDETLYEGEAVADIAVDICGQNLMHIMATFLSVTNTRFKRDQWHKSVSLWVARQRGEPNPPGLEHYEFIEEAVRAPKAWRLRLWIRRICGGIIHARSGNFLSALSDGRARDLGVALRSHVLDKMAWWASFYAVRAAELTDTGHTVFQKAVINQVRTQIYRVVEVELLDEEMRIRLPADRCGEVLYSSLSARWDSLAARSDGPKFVQALADLGKSTAEIAKDERLANPFLWEPSIQLDTLFAQMERMPAGFWTVAPRKMWAKVLESVNQSIRECVDEIKDAIEQLSTQVSNTVDIDDQETFFRHLETTGDEYILRSAVPWRYNIPTPPAPMVVMSEPGLIDDDGDFMDDDEDYDPFSFGSMTFATANVENAVDDIQQIITWREIFAIVFSEIITEDEPLWRRCYMIPANASLDDTMTDTALYGTVMESDSLGVVMRMTTRWAKYLAGELEDSVYDLQ